MSRKRKKYFECGHRGFGQYCHRCFQETGKKVKRDRLPIESRGR